MTFGEFANLPRFRMVGNDRFAASCPTSAHPHGDRSRGLSGRIFGNKIAVKCFSGCEAAEILKAMGLDWSALFADGYNKPRRPDPAADRRRRATQSLQQWHEKELQRCAEDLRTRDIIIRQIDEAVKDGAITEDEALVSLSYEYDGYSGLEFRFTRLVRNEDTLTLWRESRRVA